MLDLEAASVADLELGKCEGADFAIAVKAEYIFTIDRSEVEETTFIIEDNSFSY